MPKKTDNPVPLSSRVQAGLGWTTFSSVISQALNLARTIVLARLLTQGDFGLIGMAGTATAALAVLTNIGFGNAVIATQYETEKEEHTFLNTMWTVDVGRGLILTLLLFSMMYPASYFYREPRLIGIWPALCLTPFLQSLSNVGLNLYRRQVKYKKLAIFDMVSVILSVFIPLISVLYFKHVHALVWSQAVAVALCSALSYLYHPFRPRLSLDQDALQKGFNFGKHLFAIGVMVYITSTADNILVGKWLGASALGVYLVAYSLAGLPQQVISKLFGGILVSVYAELGRGDRERMESVVHRVWSGGAAFITLISVPLFVSAYDLISLLYGPSWQEAAGPLRILLLVGLLRGLIQLLGPLLMGMNRPDLEAKSTYLEAGVFLIVLYPLIDLFGTNGAAWAGVLVYTVAFGARFWLARTIVPQAVDALPQILLKVIVAGLTGWAVGSISLGALPSESSSLLRIVSGATTTAVTIAFALLLIDRQFRTEIDSIKRLLMRNRETVTS
jgi:PST family polysaccharide transporter/lipopolysaccharide exporter